MNWDYVRGKKKTKRKIKINKQKGNKQKKNKLKKIKKKFIRQFGSVFNKKMVKSVIYLLFSYQTARLREYRS